MAMMAITTRSSIRVKCWLQLGRRIRNCRMANPRDHGHVGIEQSVHAPPMPGGQGEIRMGSGVFVVP